MALESLQLLYPEILLSALALILLAADLWIPPRHGRALFHFGMLAAGLTLAMLGLSYPAAAGASSASALWVADPLSLFFKVIVLVTTVMTLLLSLDYPLPSEHLGSFSALVLFATLGMMLLVSATDLLLIFLSLELVSISSFILTGFHRGDLKSSEGAIKYFLIGAFSSAIMVYGISLFYGAAGTTSLTGLHLEMTPMLLFSLMLLVVGFGFKASIAPFHLWVPDAYEGAPTPVTLFLSVAPKVAALAAMLRVFLHLLPASGVELAGIFSFLAMLTMTVGNFTAIFQTNVKRMLAYSSIAQAGYMLIGFVAGGQKGIEGVLMYSLVYLFMNLGAFAVAIVIGNQESYELDAYDGLAKRHLPMALLMTFFLLSLAGIPPLGGFVAKFYVFAAAIEARLYVLAVVGVLNSVVSVYYYMLIAYHMFFKPARTDKPINTGLYLTCGLTVAALGVFLLGLYPDPFILTVKASAVMAGPHVASAAPARVPAAAGR
ncbi:MAG: NADH-quinone oxidoreductase subunit N [Elusimicrobia bacterium]|nr:NADH-quinone oxidoreductase subunit N [Elusimicrobiota bacterium]